MQDVVPEGHGPWRPPASQAGTSQRTASGPRTRSHDQLTDAVDHAGLASRRRAASGRPRRAATWTSRAASAAQRAGDGAVGGHDLDAARPQTRRAAAGSAALRRRSTRPRARPRASGDRRAAGDSAQVPVEHDAHQRAMPVHARAPSAAGRRPAPCPTRRRWRRPRARGAASSASASAPLSVVALARAGRDAAVEAHRHLQLHPGSPEFDRAEERRVLAPRLAPAHARRHLDAVRAQVGEARARSPAGSGRQPPPPRGGCRPRRWPRNRGRCGRCDCTARACSTAWRPARARPRPRSATTSACGPPATWWCPTPTTTPSSVDDDGARRSDWASCGRGRARRATARAP